MDSTAPILYLPSLHSTDPVPLHSVYSKLQNVNQVFLQIAVHTVERNWISRLEYLTVSLS